MLLKTRLFTFIKLCQMGLITSLSQQPQICYVYFFLPTSNFFRVFLLKSLYYPMIVRNFVATESATLPI